MSWLLHGIGASAGRTSGPSVRIAWDIPAVAHRTIEADAVASEIERFEEAREWARQRILLVREETSERIGSVEGKIFEAQAMMLDDPDLVAGTTSYIRENFLPAERAFDWRLLEFRSQFADTAHVMALDRLADLRDIRYRVLSRLLGLEAEDILTDLPDAASVLVFDELTPGLAVQVSSAGVLGLLSAAGSRASHSAVIARSLGIPCVVGIGPPLAELSQGTTVILDGATGQVIVDPTEGEMEAYQRSVVHTRERDSRLEELACCPTVTSDGVKLVLQANLDQPDDVAAAQRVGAEGVGLFRSEFLVIGRRTIPSEDEQFEAYRRVVEAFPEQGVTLRTFDIGGDKFPIFLPMPMEENPYLGWRAIRVCLDLPELFRNQLRAAVRAAEHGKVRILVPFIVSPDEIRRTRDMLDEIGRSFEPESVPDVPLGIMIETPAAVETVDLLAPHVDFLSLGTNDLTQYALAVDRGNARLVDLFDPLHPALFRMYRRLAEAARDQGVELNVCGALAEEPVGLSALIGLGYRRFSLPAPAHPEIQEIVLAVSAADLTDVARGIDKVDDPRGIRRQFERYLEEILPEGEGLLNRLSVV
jgi:phosphotransferase system enzyme I (PtsI)